MRPVNTVFQNYALFPLMTVRENVAFGLRYQDVSKERGRPTGQRRAGAGPHRRARAPRPAQLSGGQQQRVALARALVLNPRVLLLDEPLGALDAQLRKHLQLQLRQLQRDVGITFVYVTHDQEEALTMSDRIAVIADGKVEQVGSPEEIYARPATAYVAGVPRLRQHLRRRGHRRLRHHGRLHLARPHPGAPRRTATCRAGRRRSWSDPSGSPSPTRPRPARRGTTG